MSIPAHPEVYRFLPSDCSPPVTSGKNVDKSLIEPAGCYVQKTTILVHCTEYRFFLKVFWGFLFERGLMFYCKPHRILCRFFEDFTIWGFSGTVLLPVQRHSQNVRTAKIPSEYLPKNLCLVECRTQLAEHRVWFGMV